MADEPNRGGVPWLEIGAVAAVVAAFVTAYGVWLQNPGAVRRDLDHLSHVDAGAVLAVAGFVFLVYLVGQAWRMLRRCALSGELGGCGTIWLMVAGCLYLVAHATAAKYDVLSIPTMLVFQGREPMKKIIGAYPRGRLLAEIAPLIGEPNSAAEVREDVLSITLDNGILRVAILKGDGTYSYVTEDANRLGLVYLPATVELTSAIDELESLLNDSYSTKEQIQAFLAKHEDVILGGEYKTAHSRIFLRRDGHPALRADFVLEPIAGELADVFEIQPAHASVAHDIDGIAQLSDVVIEACARLREYRDYFEDEIRRVQIEDEHGVRLFRPRMFIVIGRANQMDAITKRRLETQLNDVKLRSWDEVLAVARANLHRAHSSPKE